MSENNLNKLKWQCRRGVLELDVLLERFLVEKYPSLSHNEQMMFAKLLSCNDQELLSWFFDEEAFVPSEFNDLLKKIRF